MGENTFKPVETNPCSGRRGHSGQAHGRICPKCKLPQQGSSFAGIMHSFAGIVHNEDTTLNNNQVLHIWDVMSIFLDLILEFFFFTL
jgi:hypothetical protein